MVFFLILAKIAFFSEFFSPIITQQTQVSRRILCIFSSCRELVVRNLPIRPIWCKCPLPILYHLSGYVQLSLIRILTLILTPSYGLSEQRILA